MEELTYNILWIDDEHDKLLSTKGRAKRNGINLIPFKSLNGGMSELERNFPNYDGILLDAKIFENESDKKGTEDISNVFKAQVRLLQLQKQFEIFVLTGQAQVYNDNIFNKAFAKVYKKGSDEEIDRLFGDIKNAAFKQNDTQIRHEYKRVFEVCSEWYIGELAGQDILSLIKLDDTAELTHGFNSIRKVVEDIFIAFNKFDLLPSEFITPTVSLNESSKFLTGKKPNGEFFIEKGFRHLDGTHLPKLVSDNLRRVLSVTQSGSHRSEIDDYINTVRTPFLFKSVLYLLLDVIAWFKVFVDTSTRKHNWEKVTMGDEVVSAPQPVVVPGVVINLHPIKGFAFLQPNTGGINYYISPNLVTQYALINNASINCEIEEYVDNRTGEKKGKVRSIIV